MPDSVSKCTNGHYLSTATSFLKACIWAGVGSRTLRRFTATGPCQWAAKSNIMIRRGTHSCKRKTSTRTSVDSSERSGSDARTYLYLILRNFPLFATVSSRPMLKNTTKLTKRSFMLHDCTTTHHFLFVCFGALSALAQSNRARRWRVRTVTHWRQTRVTWRHCDGRIQRAVLICEVKRLTWNSAIPVVKFCDDWSSLACTVQVFIMENTFNSFPTYDEDMKTVPRKVPVLYHTSTLYK